MISSSRIRASITVLSGAYPSGAVAAACSYGDGLGAAARAGVGGPRVRGCRRPRGWFRLLDLTAQGESPRPRCAASVWGVGGTVQTRWLRHTRCGGWRASPRRLHDPQLGADRPRGGHRASMPRPPWLRHPGDPPAAAGAPPPRRSPGCGGGRRAGRERRVG